MGLVDSFAAYPGFAFYGNSGSGGGAPSGTGFVKVTNGVYDTPGNLSAAEMPTGIDATKLADGSVSNAEYQRLNGVTGDIQTQLDGKAASSHNHAGSAITSGTIDPARLGSGTPGSGNYLRGDGSWQTVSATDSSKIPLATVTTKGDLITATGSGAVTRRAVGSANQFLAPNSGNSDGLEWRALVPGDIPALLTLAAPKVASQSAAAGDPFTWGTPTANTAGLTYASGTWTATIAGWYLVISHAYVGASAIRLAVKRNGTALNPGPEAIAGYICEIIYLAVGETFAVCLASGYSGTPDPTYTSLAVTLIGR